MDLQSNLLGQLINRSKEILLDLYNFILTFLNII